MTNPTDSIGSLSPFTHIHCSFCLDPRESNPQPTLSNNDFRGGVILATPPAITVCPECASNIAHRMYHKGWQDSFLFSLFVGISDLPRRHIGGVVHMCRLHGWCESETDQWIPYDTRYETRFAPQ